MQVAAVIVRAVRRRMSWDTVGAAMSVTIVIAACVALFYLLRDIDIARVGATLRATPPQSVLVAAALVAASYFTLTFYDFFALRTIGQTHVPYRTAALTGLLSYTIGHNLGATVLTGGAVRLRIYKAWGLTLLDVAKVAFVTGLTFWLGNAVALGLGIIYAPDVAGAINQLPTWANRAIAAALLGTILGYLIWLRPRPRVIGYKGWTLTLPNARLTLVQIGIGLCDLGLAALAMYVLISAHTSVDVVSAMVAYVFAALLGFASHAPGSLGVFDAAMLLALPQIEKEQLLASLLIFRCLYFVVPFFIAISALAIRELWISVEKELTGSRGNPRCPDS
jgi:uncharacterized membrane protein YbhN (UPF0104 family)